jgi:nitroimidazol reductase NimA-like FMN-containing flavoprotein (pyridoxamine 5'-phosphate oxidase superfamily)
MEPEPRASRPRMSGYGVPQGSEGVLPWDWARERLTRSHNYWLTTSRADGVPHTMPVWGLWLAGAWYFSTFSTSRKARNLAENPHCVVCNDNAEEAVILEGVAQPIPASQIPQNASAEYKAKYGWELQGSVFKVQPRVVFAMPEKQFPGSVTRWNFA